jgi:two-component system, OmpR family, phosphate regulon sensor histidine kinase PhoR
MDLDINSYDPNRERLAGVLATVGHELRTPLTSIRGYVETLLGGGLDPSTTRRFLETVRRETLRLGRLVDGMLEFSLLDLSVQATIASCDAVEQISAAVEMLAPLASVRGVTIRTRLPQTACVRVDGDACVHALANLLQNAIKYGRAGGSVGIECARDGRRVRISVQDDGEGIAPGERDAIFRLGFRGSREGDGCGIGLAVVRAIAQRTGGDVCVEASSGGARFVLTFPAG